LYSYLFSAFAVDFEMCAFSALQYPKLLAGCEEISESLEAQFQRARWMRL